MEAGRLRHRVALQQVTETRNAIGEVARAWATTATVWAAVEDLRGQEFLQAQQTGGELTTRIRIRDGYAVGPGWRAVHGAVVYDVKAVVMDRTRARELQLMCVRAA